MFSTDLIRNSVRRNFSLIKSSTVLINMMSSLTMNIACNGKYAIIIFLSILLLFFVVMDINLYISLQSTTLVGQKRIGSQYFSPFEPLSMKLLMTDPVNHYIFTPLAEYFDDVTQFSKVFYFITPNMISFTHLVLAFVAGKFVSSESLGHRRLGVVIYHFRNWLDDLDGVVYRSHSQTKGIYRSNKSNIGYYIDIYSDIIGGFALSFGILFYLWKCPPSRFNHSVLPVKLPDTTPQSPERQNGSPVRKSFPLNFLTGTERPSGGLTRKYIFWKVFCFGFTLIVAAGTWDKVVERYTYVFQSEFTDPKITALQTEALHSTWMWIIILMWRVIEGQALLQMVLLSVFIDRVWEFFNFMQYLGIVLVIILNIVSDIHIRQVHHILGIN
ncbi:hypothetical protein CHS0354_026077 [Potamilus streckersoni]|uniref:Ceramide phosphoethanolamine synthase n=1 Tax=Potamilus streckersoni TaxID=2493646 RepID=A0AAE0VW75_9BIVA|nr:hypothetical protein CHS0354_026077 [Potamilus streckersoni]